MQYAKVEQQLRDLLVSGDFDAWSEAVARVGNCSQPIRLRGRSETVDTASGEVVSSYSEDLTVLESPVAVVIRGRRVR